MNLKEIRKIGQIFKSLEKKNRERRVRSCILFLSQINIKNPDFLPPRPDRPYVFSFYVKYTDSTSGQPVVSYPLEGQIHITEMKHAGYTKDNRAKYDMLGRLGYTLNGNESKVLENMQLEDMCKKIYEMTTGLFNAPSMWLVIKTKQIPIESFDDLGKINLNMADCLERIDEDKVWHRMVEIIADGVFGIIKRDKEMRRLTLMKVEDVSTK